MMEGAQAAPAGLLRVSADELLAYPTSVATSLRRVGEARVPLEDAPETRIIAFRAADGGIEHRRSYWWLTRAVLAVEDAPLVRLHSECFTGSARRRRHGVAEQRRLKSSAAPHGGRG